MDWNPATQLSPKPFHSSTSSPFNVPNIICYIRILVSFHILLSPQSPSYKIQCLVVAALLDLIDGPIARRLQCCSRFGSLLDIISDNILRTTSWLLFLHDFSRKRHSLSLDSSQIHPLFHSIPYLINNNPSPTSPMAFSDNACLILSAIVTGIISLEWVTMIFTQLHASEDARHWKTCRASDPPLVAHFFSNSFKNPLGTIGILGIFCLPLVLYSALNVTDINENFFFLLLTMDLQVLLMWVLLVVFVAGRAISFGVEWFLVLSFVGHLLESKEERSGTKEE